MMRYVLCNIYTYIFIYILLKSKIANEVDLQDSVDYI
jgi:hypothetical protein